MLGFRSAVFLLSSLLASLSWASSYTGTTPELSITPGKLCERTSERRYPEGVAYCKRDVTTVTKKDVFREYGVDFNDPSNVRDNYKIDHLIPLCVGGSNDITNLWPQPASAYMITDPLEPLLCEKMAQGKLEQSEAVELVIEAKTHLDRVDRIFRYVSRL